MSITNYRAFGLHIQSAVPLPELPPAGNGRDITIRLGSSKDWLLHSRSDQEENGIISAKAFHFKSACGHFFVLNGREIIVDPHLSLDDRYLGFYLLERVIIALLYQRDIAVFHASTVSINGTAVSFLGPPHSGKTAIASSFCSLGCRMVDDDILAFRLKGNTSSVLPGYPMIKLWPNLLKLLNISLDQVRPVFPGQDKRVYRLECFSSHPLPLGAIYVLEESDSLKIEKLAPVHAVRLLMASWYGLLYGELFPMAGGYSKAFLQSVYLCKTTRVSRLCRPRGFSHVPELIDMIEKDMKQ